MSIQTENNTENTYSLNSTESDRTTFYAKGLQTWKNYQVTMITEEGGELITEISHLLKLITKKQRDSPTAIIHAEKLINKTDFQKLKPILVDEVGDLILILDQFYGDFQSFSE